MYSSAVNAGNYSDWLRWRVNSESLGLAHASHFTPAALRVYLFKINANLVVGIRGGLCVCGARGAGLKKKKED